MELGAVDAFIADKAEQQQKIWEARKATYDAYNTFYDLDEADICVPRSMIPEFIDETEAIAKKRGVLIAAVGHAGDGNIHCNIIRQDQSEKDWPIVLEETISDLVDTGIKMGGTVSGEHGLGYTKRSYLERKVGKTQIEIMKAIKAVFDPNLILNPNKLWM
jgi:glycolate oxidase